VHTQRK